MRKIEETQIINLRPLFFLCGPYYEDNSKDRRNILRLYLNYQEVKLVYNETEFQIIPFALIIDKMFNTTEDYNLGLLEEIISSCAYKNYVFLDSISTAVELGLFSNSYSQNKSVALVPKDYQYFEPSIGGFVTETIKNSNNIDLCMYTNKRSNKFVPKEKQCIPNLIYFKGKKVPKEIIKNIQDSFTDNINNFVFSISFSSDVNEVDKINYNISNDKIIFTIPPKILFYLVFIHCDDIKGIKKEIIKEFGYFAYSNSHELLLLYYQLNFELKEIVINSRYQCDINEVILTMNLLIKKLNTTDELYKSKYKKLKYIRLNYKNRLKINAFELFNLQNKQLMTMKKRLSKSIDSKTIIVNKKIRKIKMYSNNSNGYMIISS